MSKDIKKWSYETKIKYLDNENAELKQDKEAIYSIWKKAINRENDLIVDNKQLKKRINNLVSENTRLQNYLFSEQLEQDEKEDYINKLKEKNKTLIESKKIWVDSHRQVTQEKNKLSNELTSKIRHEYIQTLEINELKRELKEYRWF